VWGEAASLFWIPEAGGSLLDVILHGEEGSWSLQPKPQHARLFCVGKGTQPTDLQIESILRNRFLRKHLFQEVHMGSRNIPKKFQREMQIPDRYPTYEIFPKRFPQSGRLFLNGFLNGWGKLNGDKGAQGAYLFWITCSTDWISSRNPTGLVRYRVAPASIPDLMSPGMLFAETMITGMDINSGSRRM
jgi:hypothetical protein